jgi:hypothetical protein
MGECGRAFVVRQTPGLSRDLSETLLASCGKCILSKMLKPTKSGKEAGRMTRLGRYMLLLLLNDFENLLAPRVFEVMQNNLPLVLKNSTWLVQKRLPAPLALSH